MRYIILSCCFFTITAFAQPVPTEYYMMKQKDSLYYLITDKGILKFYSIEASGEFYLTAFYERDFDLKPQFTLNDDHIILAYKDTIFFFNNTSPWELSLDGFYIPGYHITYIFGFGPYFFIRSEETYNLLKFDNGTAITVEDNLFTQPSQRYVFITYPFVVISDLIYKYVAGFDFYPVAPIDIGNVNTGIYGNTLIAYFFWYPPVFGDPPESYLHKFIIEEPDFPHYVYSGWGMNIPQLHISLGNGELIPSENLYYIKWANVIVTPEPVLAYQPSEGDKISITDYYIFLVGDSVQFSKWYAGSVFYPFNWTDLTSTEEFNPQNLTYSLYQNFPNPFNPVTKITWQSPESSRQTIKVFDVLGREIVTLVDEELPPGNHEIEFDARDLTAGIYFYRLSAGKFSETKKMILIK